MRLQIPEAIRRFADPWLLPKALNLDASTTADFYAAVGYVESNKQMDYKDRLVPTDRIYMIEVWNELDSEIQSKIIKSF